MFACRCLKFICLSFLAWCSWWYFIFPYFHTSELRQQGNTPQWGGSDLCLILTSLLPHPPQCVLDLESLILPQLIFSILMLISTSGRASSICHQWEEQLKSFLKRLSLFRNSLINFSRLFKNVNCDWGAELQVPRLSAVLLQVNETGNQFPGKSRLSPSTCIKLHSYFFFLQTLFIAPLTGAIALQQNYTPGEEGAARLTLNGFNKVRAWRVILLPLNSRCHKGKLMALERGPDMAGVLNLLSHLRFRLSECGPCLWWHTYSSVTRCLSARRCAYVRCKQIKMCVFCS